MKYVIGIDIGGTNVKGGVLTQDGEVLKSYSIKTDAKNGAEDVLNRIKELVEVMLKENNISKEDVIGAGMGIPGPVNTDTGIVNFCPNMIGWENFPAAKLMTEKTGIKFKVGNDVNVITMGEYWKGAARGYKNVLGITLGTGIGGGIIINGNLVSGISGAAGEVGHLKVEENGKLCGCGQYGCWEAYASATGLIRETMSRLMVNTNTSIWAEFDKDMSDYKDKDMANLEAKHIFDAAKKGDRLAMELVDFEVRYLALGVASLINVINPEIVVIGGGISLAGDILFDKLKTKLKENTLKVALDAVKIVPAELKNDAGVVGAAALVI